MTTSKFLPHVVELSGTYLVQSTLFIVGAWLVLIAMRGWKNRSNIFAETHLDLLNPGLVESIWKYSAVLALVTAPIGLFNGYSIFALNWSINSKQPMVVALESMTAVETQRPFTSIRQPAALSPLLDVPRTEESDRKSLCSKECPLIVENAPIDEASDAHQGRDKTLVPRPELRLQNPPHVASSALSKENLRSSFKATLASSDAIKQSIVNGFGMILLIWIAVTSLRLLSRWVCLSRLLADCEPIVGKLRQELIRITPKGKSIRLLRSRGQQSETSKASVKSINEPIACGLFRWTVVLPQWVEQQLSAAELKALLAHEAAHLIRRDPLWLLLGEILCTTFAFQPLNFLARKCWLQATEILCDDWAVQRDVSASSLANCLIRVAEWRLNGHVAQPGLNAVGHTGQLSRRIEWLFRENRVPDEQDGRGRFSVTLAALVMGLAFGAYGPRITIVQAADARDDIVATDARDEINRELDETANDLAWIESQVAGDPAAASLARRIQDRVSSLRQRIRQ